MTKVGQLIQEEIEEAAAAAAAKATKEAKAEAAKEIKAAKAAVAKAEKEATERDREIVKNMLRKGMAVSDVAECMRLPIAETEMLAGIAR
jgi:ribulose 1,5-bisphosphate synthetase/thiazole synthase